jgi:hypothetical protein
MIMINSFNEWHDGSEIEPSKEEGEGLLNLIAQAHILTNTNKFTRHNSIFTTRRRRGKGY